MSEIELKFGIAATSVRDIDRALTGRGARSIAIESRYWDTPDLRLAQADLSLRLRKSRGRWEQTVKAGGRSLPVCEVEAELKQGDPSDLIEFGRRSVDAHAMWLSTLSKAARGHLLARGSSDTPPAVKSRRPRFRDDASGRQIFHAA